MEVNDSAIVYNTTLVSTATLNVETREFGFRSYTRMYWIAREQWPRDCSISIFFAHSLPSANLYSSTM